MKVRRDIASVPVRSAKETWQAIVDLVSGDDTVDREQLDDAASVMEALIAEEQPANVPIAVKGGSPRVVIYCLYDEDAMEAGLDIDRLNSNPTAGDWRMTAPTEAEDVDWMNNTLKQRAPRISVHAPDKAPADEESIPTGHTANSLEIDWGALSKR